MKSFSKPKKSFSFRVYIPIMYKITTLKTSLVVNYTVIMTKYVRICICEYIIIIKNSIHVSFSKMTLI